MALNGSANLVQETDVMHLRSVVILGLSATVLGLLPPADAQRKGGVCPYATQVRQQQMQYQRQQRYEAEMRRQQEKIQHQQMIRERQMQMQMRQQEKTRQRQQAQMKQVQRASQTRNVKPVIKHQVDHKRHVVT